MNEKPVVLMAEDSKIDSLFIKRAFQQAAIPATPHFVEDGEQAIAYLSGDGAYQDRAQHPLPLFVFLDLEMPGKNGLEVLQWIRNNPRFEGLPVMMVTSSQLQKDRDAAKVLGATWYIVKNGKIGDLAQDFRKMYMYWWPLANRKKDNSAEIQGE